jgi:nicotinamide-nucleotide amidase
LAGGTEPLLGDILNPHAQFLSKELAKLGINVYFQTVVGDNADRIVNALDMAFRRADLVIATGGLGPTGDDMTKEMAARFFGREMNLNEAVWEGIQRFFRENNLTMSPTNQKQAEFPQGSQILENGNGTAPGCFIEHNGKMLFLLPGPPAEAEPMYVNAVAPILSAKSDSMFISKTLKICGLGESAAEERIADLIQNQSNPTIAPYAKTAEVWFRITAQAPNETEAARLIQPTVDEIKKRLGADIYGADDDSLESVVVHLLQEKKLTIACAESCTGGALTARLVNCPGVSAVLLEGAVTYGNAAKINRLGVKTQTLENYGAVSAQTAVEMAAGIAKTAGADVGVATTGIAGPDGGTPEKPVGLVYLGLYWQGNTWTRELHLPGDRQKIRDRTVVNALDMIRRRLLHEEG